MPKRLALALCETKNFPELNRELSDLEKLLHVTRAELEQASQAVKTKTNEIDELRQDVERATRRIHIFKSSVSWRITAPIRYITRPIRSRLGDNRVMEMHV
jgi:hypothetical protein